MNEASIVFLLLIVLAVLLIAGMLSLANDRERKARIVDERISNLRKECRRDGGTWL